MERRWKFRNKEYTMTLLSGVFSLNGWYFPDSYIWDHATDDENVKQRGRARRFAELFVKRRESSI